MMPNRIIHEKATESPTLDLLSDGAERLFWRLTTKADDHGLFDADPRVLLAWCFPLRVGRWSPGKVQGWRDELAAAGLVRLYQAGGRCYGAFTKWANYQRNRFESRPKYPKPEDSTSTALAAMVRGESRRVAADSGVYRDSLLESRDSLLESRDGVIGRLNGGQPQHAARGVQFRIPPPITDALGRAPRFRKVPKLMAPSYWLAEIRANEGVDLARELLKAEAWIEANPERAPRKNLARFLHSWFARVDRPPEDG